MFHSVAYSQIKANVLRFSPAAQRASGRGGVAVSPLLKQVVQVTKSPLTFPIPGKRKENQGIVLRLGVSKQQ